MKKLFQLALCLTLLPSAVARGQDPANPIEAAADAEAAEVVDAEMAEAAAADAKAAAAANVPPPVANAAGKNLFGDKIAPVPQERTSKPTSHLQKTVAALIKATQELTLEYKLANEGFMQNRKSLQDMKAEYSQIEPRIQLINGQWLEREQTCARLGAGNILSLPETDPNVQRYRQLRREQEQLNAEKVLLLRKGRSLPGQIRTLEGQVQKFPSQQRDLNRRIAELLNSWETMLSMLTWLSPADAQGIANQCQIALASNIDSHIIRLMKGYAQIHLDQPIAARRDINQVVAGCGTANDPTTLTIKLLSHVGLAWVGLREDNLEAAGVDISKAKAINSRDYELAVCRGHLSHRRGRMREAYNAYTAAMRIEKKNPHAYRMAAEMILDSGDSALAAKALAMAKSACRYDEQDDWRNQMVLALAHRAVGDAEQFDVTAELARDQAPPDALQTLEDALKEKPADEEVANEGQRKEGRGKDNPDAVAAEVQ